MLFVLELHHNLIFFVKDINRLLFQAVTDQDLQTIEELLLEPKINVNYKSVVC